MGISKWCERNTSEEQLILTDGLCLGRGAHKAAYVHPKDERLCVKIPFKWPDEDVKKELRYRFVLGKKIKRMPLLVKYYGTVETNLGRGYVFERVTDFDGAACITLSQYIESCSSREEMVQLMLAFRKEFFCGRYVVAGMNTDNFLVQRISPTERRLRIVDDLGTGAFIPILYYSDRLLRKRAAKYWRLLVHQMGAKYGDLITKEVSCRLMEGVAPMGICLLSKEGAPLLGLGNFLVEMGNRVTLMTMARNCQEEVRDDVHTSEMKLFHLHKTLGWFECFARFTSIAWKTDSLLLDGIPSFAVPAVLFARMLDKSVVVLVSEEDLKSFAKSKLGIEGRLLHMCEYVALQDGAMRQIVSNHYDIKARKVIVLPYEVCDAERGAIRMALESIRWLQSLLDGDN